MRCNANVSDLTELYLNNNILRYKDTEINIVLFRECHFYTYKSTSLLTENLEFHIFYYF